MKKITLLLGAFALSSLGYSQSQRLALLEEGTQASCPPCAAQNPALNTLLNANTTKVVSIKYQTSWPGVDPMNAQNPTDVAARVTYYGYTGVPNINFDGNVINNGAPNALTQANINTEYAVASPFDIAVSHTFNTALDSVYISVQITCTQAVSGTLKARVALVEKQINFTSAPGTNGETVFYSVMRKMYPDQSGTVLPTAWTVGQTQTLTFAAKVPSYIYDMKQLAVVAFVQDDANKNVKQAGISMPLTLPASTDDAGINAVTGLNAVACVTTVTPSVTIKNYSANTLTTCTVNYQLDGGSVQSLPFSGSIAPGATGSFALPAMTVSVGSHILTSYTSMPNGNNDYFLNNNSNKKTFNIIGSSSAAPLVEAFTATTFPPTNWVIDNPDGAYTWARVTTAGVGTPTASTKMNFFNSPAGQIDEMYTKSLDLTTSNSFAYVTFDVAYAQYASENDKLQVMVSDNCGATWTTPYSKQGTGLMTAAATTTAFTPTASQWRNELVDISSFVNKPNVLVKFKATSAYGNNLYVDNINIFTSSSAVTSVADNSAIINTFNVYPNPIANEATIQYTLAAASQVAVVMYNVLGEMVYNSNIGSVSSGEHLLKVDTQNLNNGVYFVTLTANDGKTTKKVVINK
jgi:hypothetical protein